MSTPWFSTWFNSPYYSLLYKNRDEQEARRFIDRLLETLQLQPDMRVLDLACGRGRYSRYLAEKELEVIGIDISEQSIESARQYESDRLHFYTHDMRQPFHINYFDYIFNFFTSFGYFENDRDHQRTLKNIANGLVPGGWFVLDFFNAKKVIRDLRQEEEKTIEGVHFILHRMVDARGYIVKKITIRDGGQEHQYEERVKAFTLADLERLFGQAGLRVERLYGDYQLNPFDEADSDRLILIAQKNG